MHNNRKDRASESVSMLGKNCVVTGATSGIGKAAALELGKMGAQIILIGRNTARGRHAANRINAGRTGGRAEFIKCDLSSQSEIRDLAKTIGRLMPTIDVLVNNAGARFDTFHKSKDGIEMTFATNHLSYFLLTELLMEYLMNAPAARIVNIAGQSHWDAHSNFQPCLRAEQYDRRFAYQQVTLARLMFTYDLAERLRGTPITVNAVHPGGVATRISMNNSIFSWIRHIGAHMLSRNLISPRRGADTVVWLATANDIQGISGKYFYQRKPIDSSPESKNKEATRQLWNLSLRMTNLAKSKYFS
jgi:NAD(P)-dependent dehydrogenase (short-subunit alcohol dehydrogenase family)